MAVDGRIVIKTKIDAKGFNSGMKSMMNGLGKLTAALGLAFSVGAMINFGKQSVEVARKFEERWQGLAFLIRSKGLSFKEAKDYITEYTNDGLVPVMNATKSYMNLLATGFNHDEIKQLMEVMKDAAVYLRKGQFEIGDAVEKTTEGIRTERSILTDTSGIERNLYKMWQDYAQSIGKTITSLTDAEKRQAVLNGFLKEGAVYAGAAAQYVDTYAGRTAQLAFAMTQLKEAVGNALIPVLNQLLPHILRIVTWFTKLFNIVARVMNLLFGTQVSMADVGESAGEAGEGADEFAGGMERGAAAAKSILAAFDKIDVLQRPKKPGGGGGGKPPVGGMPPVETPDLGGFAEELDELEKKIREFIALIKGLFEAGEFEKLGRMAGKALSDGLVWGLQWLREKIGEIDWGGIGEAIAGFINGIDWGALISETAGLIIDLFIGLWETVAGLVSEIDWLELGTELADGLLGAIEGIDWEKLAKSFFSFWGSAIVGIRLAGFGFVKRIIEKIVDAVDDGIKTFKQDLEDAGGDVLEAIKTGLLRALINISKWIADNIIDPFMTAFLGAFGVDWEEVKEKGQELAGEFLDGLAEAYENVTDWVQTNVVDVLLDAFELTFGISFDEFKEKGKEIINGIYEGIKTALSDVGTWIKDNIFTPIIDGFKFVFGISSSSTVMAEQGGYLIEGLYEGIKKGFSNAKQWFEKNILEPIKKFFRETWEDVQKKAEEAWDGVKKAWNGAKEWFDTKVLTPIKNFFTEKWDDIKQKAETTYDDVKTAWNGAKDWFDTEVLTPLKDEFSQKWDDIKLKSSDTWDDVKGVWDGTKDWFDKNLLSPLKEAFRKSFGSITGYMESPFLSFGEVVRGAFNKVIDFMNGLIDGIKRGVNWIIQKLNGIKFRLPSWIPGAGGEQLNLGMPTISGYSIPHLATGAVIPPNAPFAAVLGDQRSGRNIETPEALLRAIVREELARGSIGSQEVKITFDGTMGQLVRSLNPRIEVENRRQGSSFLVTAKDVI